MVRPIRERESGGSMWPSKYRGSNLAKSMAPGIHLFLFRAILALISLREWPGDVEPCAVELSNPKSRELSNLKPSRLIYAAFFITFWYHR